MEKEIFIIGAGSIGGHIVTNKNIYKLNERRIYFIDDDYNKIGTLYCGIQILGSIEFLSKYSNEIEVIIAIANPNVKRVIVEKLEKNDNISFTSLIASNSWVSNDVTIGKGCIIYPNCSINFGAELDDFVTINMNCAIGHHTKISKFSSLSPSVSTGGYTVISECVEIGIGAITLQKIRIGSKSIVGAGSVVVSDIKENLKFAGVPAKELLLRKKQVTRN